MQLHTLQIRRERGILPDPCFVGFSLEYTILIQVVPAIEQNCMHITCRYFSLVFPKPGEIQTWIHVIIRRALQEVSYCSECSKSHI